MNYEDHSKVLELLRQSQDADSDNRERARENWLFLNKTNGQWEPHWWDASDGKPRYSFDMCNPIVDQIAGEMEKSEFSIRVLPKGGDASKDTAKIYDGMIRDIETNSNASEIYNAAGRLMISTGIDGWRIVQKYIDDNSFDQELVIQKVSNFIDRVWFDANSEEQDKSDAEFCFVLQAISVDEYKENWPEGSGQSISEDRHNSAYYQKPEHIVVGEFMYAKYIPRTIIMMSNGQVYEDNEEFRQVEDELASAGVVEVNRRVRKDRKICIRKMDGDGWLEKPKDTVFSYIPVVPTFGNYTIFENKQIYWGVVEKLIDTQRVLNYSMSRQIEEGALAPRAKYWMTKEQAKGFGRSLSTLNTNSDPVQFYNNDTEVPGPPMQQGGAQVNAGLKVITDTMRELVNQQSGFYAANMGEGMNAQSGAAISALQERGDTGNIRYFRSQKVAIRHTARILIDALPKVFDGEREVRLMNEDGSMEISSINRPVVDQQSGDVIALNDLSRGSYDVTCSTGPSFASRREQTVSSIIDMAQLYPQIIERNADILLSNIDAPGMDQLAERERLKLFGQMQIPESQMTEEEKQKHKQIMQMQQSPPTDPAAMKMAEAEQMKAEADMQNAHIKGMQVQSNAALQEQKNQLELQKLQQDAALQRQKLEQGDMQNMLTANQRSEQFRLEIKKQQQDLILSMREQQRKSDESVANIKLQNAKIIEILSNLTGVGQQIAPPQSQLPPPSSPSPSPIDVANMIAMEDDIDD